MLHLSSRLTGCHCTGHKSALVLPDSYLKDVILNLDSWKKDVACDLCKSPRFGIALPPPPPPPFPFLPNPYINLPYLLWLQLYHYVTTMRQRQSTSCCNVVKENLSVVHVSRAHSGWHITNWFTCRAPATDCCSAVEAAGTLLYWV